MEIVKPLGILDKNSGPDLLVKIVQLLDETASDIWIDCELVTFMDSAGLGFVIQAFKHARSLKRDLHLCRVNCQLRTVLELTSADRILLIHDH